MWKGEKKKRERKKTPTAQRRREEEYQRTEKLGQETKHNISRKLVALSAPILSTRNDDDRGRWRNNYFPRVPTPLRRRSSVQ